MTVQPEANDGDETNAQAEVERLEPATDEAIAACGGDLRATVRALRHCRIFGAAGLSRLSTRCEARQV
jgi:hypothetical protein